MNAINPQPRRGNHLVKADKRRFRTPFPLKSAWLAWLGHALLDRIDARLVHGRLEAWLPDGTFRVLGGRAQDGRAQDGRAQDGRAQDGRSTGWVCEVRLRDWRALARLVTGGSVGWYRAWELGEWSSPAPERLFALFMANATSLGGVARSHGPLRWAMRAVHWLRRNSRTGARRNIAAHYDLGNDFYRVWLDAGMNYSSALFDDPEHPDEGLAAAQIAKNDAVLDRLNLKGGQRLLEIGCGWGALAERGLDRADIDYDGITLSHEQAAWARTRLPRHRAAVYLRDYRDMRGQYDAIASIEMVEAVGQKYWPDYIAAIHRLLKPGGRAVIQYISIDDAVFDRYARSADFIQSYIFPGGMLISESRFRALAGQAGLEWQDQRSFGRHYATTLRLWRARFEAAVDAGRLPRAFDERFVKLWRYYLLYCEGGFLGGGINVAQVTLVKPRG